MKINLTTNSMEQILPEKLTGLQLAWEFPIFPHSAFTCQDM